MSLRASILPTTVTHRLKTVRRQFVDLRLPAAPPVDQEAFVLRDQHGQTLAELSPADFHAFVACCQKALSDATGGGLGVNVKLFRRNPIEVEAVRVTAENAEGVAGWVRANNSNGTGESYQRYLFGVPQTMVVTWDANGIIDEAIEGMWVFKDADGQFYGEIDERFREEYAEA